MQMQPGFGLLSPAQVAEAMRRAAMQSGTGVTFDPSTVSLRIRIDPCDFINLLALASRMDILGRVQQMFHALYQRALTIRRQGIQSRLIDARLNCPNFSIDLDIDTRVNVPAATTPGELGRLFERVRVPGITTFGGRAAFRIGAFLEIVLSPVTFTYTARLCFFGQIARLDEILMPAPFDEAVRVAANSVLRQPICIDVTRYVSQSELEALSQQGRRMQ